MSETSLVHSPRVPRHHRTVDRVTRILELVASHPGLTASQLARVLDAPKSSPADLARALCLATIRRSRGGSRSSMMTVSSLISPLRYQPLAK